MCVPYGSACMETDQQVLVRRLLQQIGIGRAAGPVAAGKGVGGPMITNRAQLAPRRIRLQHREGVDEDHSAYDNGCRAKMAHNERRIMVVHRVVTMGGIPITAAF